MQRPGKEIVEVYNYIVIDNSNYTKYKYILLYLYTAAGQAHDHHDTADAGCQHDRLKQQNQALVRRRLHIATKWRRDVVQVD